MDYYLQYVLDSTMTTLERRWKPVLLSSTPFVEDNPAGLAFVLERLDPAELARVRRSGPVFDALVTRPGIDLQARRDALDALAKAHGTSVVRELFAAVDRLDGQPGGGAAAGDLLQILAGLDRAALGPERAGVERLARTGRSEAVREGAFAALLQIDGRADAAWALTEAIAAAADRSAARGGADRRGPGDRRDRGAAPAVAACRVGGQCPAPGRAGRAGPLCSPRPPRSRAGAQHDRGPDLQPRRERGPEGHGVAVETSRPAAAPAAMPPAPSTAGSSRSCRPTPIR